MTPLRIANVVIAEDDPDDRLLIQEAFTERCPEYPLCFVGNGEELLEMLGRGSELPGLILLDLNMPLKDGRETLAELKSHPTLGRIPVVIMTTSRDEDDIRHCYANGANAYIVKPTRFSELLDIVGRLPHDWIDTDRRPVKPETHE